MRWLVILATLQAGAVAGCQSTAVTPPTRPAIFAGDNEAIQQRMLAKVPLGTTQSEAEKVVKELGLSCRPKIDAQTGEPYLVCGHRAKSSVLVDWIWEIRVKCPRGVVTEIQCRQFGYGP